MPALNDDLSDFARAIVRGEEPSPQHSRELPELFCRRRHRCLPQQLSRQSARHACRRVSGHRATRRQGFFPAVDATIHRAASFAQRQPASLRRGDGRICCGLRTRARTGLTCRMSRRWNGPATAPISPTMRATLDIAKLAQIPPEQYPDLILHIHPACHLVRSRYPVAAIWHAHQPGAADDFHIDLDSGPAMHWSAARMMLSWSANYRTSDADWLQAIQAGTPLGDATAATLERHPDFDLQAALLNLVAHGVLTDFNLSETP